MRIPCPFGDEPCPHTLTVTLIGRYRCTRDFEEPESPELTATGCPHVDEASGYDWRRPGGIEDTLWGLMEVRELDAWEAEMERGVEMGMEDGRKPRAP